MQSRYRQILGLVSLIFGTVLVAWVIYNVFVKQVSAYSGPKTILELVIGGFGFGGLLFRYGWHSLMILLGLRENKDFES